MMSLAVSMKYSNIERRLVSIADKLKKDPDPIADELRQALSDLVHAIKQDVERLENPPKRRLAGDTV